ncbi:UDP-N-acetylmuramate dehydrogenase [Mycobacterium haemophilum]|uniref:UDP-N-acetylenolpyruvoylglucosamine reductase n=1 Tax=Mycobacterium haemophilum TaxID=29311 RepID=A0A0I9VEY6_9MYCO|nr:UDP-N-acetylmuramate dehydrogenase [Mycobacterium haemophilum]AKN18286.1 UDP-N-acetylenolpyruvoylglucosamine reductase [Mycobacterium haemophilum DSM 44634]KLO33112.1 UDP-N-acetylenolpyruvoylglucosamine reductase [Mycobacterium haemophilum]KLO38067.1 UDP-N-acetylenolpyruvoylglucosamine reductase [Mycobacterium haemophilum]KLO44389.1 UDP-N-acetylenolpyruvoylglucosamine reductase [Mycobacterium haemophilum]KLO55294.1 UDP-N-acetylenolpyruvoylglucosamine reductase [Mycobacterium haemophilum]
MKRSAVGSLFAGAHVAEAVPLAPLTTLRVGPVAQRVITCTSTEQVVDVIRQLDAPAGGGAAGPLLVFAGGSNLVIADTLADLTAVRLANAGVTIDGDLVRAEAGAVWDDVVASTIEHGLGGLECLSGIPGSAGATPVQNVGAYGAEVSDTITRVRLLERSSGTVRWVPARELRFGYRTSVFQQADPSGLQPPAVVLEVEFKLDASGCSAPLRYGELAAALDATSGQRADPHAVREAVLALRARKGMVLDAADHDTWSVGSFFTNPVVAPDVYHQLAKMVDGPVPHYPAPDGVKLAAGWLVERAGFGKGYPDDAAPCRLSTKHALALTNRGSATAEDVITLARTVRNGVLDVFGITLQPEPTLVGCVL